MAKKKKSKKSKKEAGPDSEQSLQQAFIAHLMATGRTGMRGLIDYLIEGGFFESPASTKYHGAYPGGLAEHSYSVFKLLRDHAANLKLDKPTGPGQEPLEINDDAIVIAALLHDVCKMGAYIGDEAPYKWNKQQPKGHALLSIERITEHIHLMEIEELMIKYHMGVYGLNEFYKEDDWQSGEFPLRGDDTKTKEERRGKSLANAWYHNPIVKLMYFCDEIATLYEKAEM